MRLPSDKDRIGIIGQNGSGKTVAGLWHLEKRDFYRMPWTVVDFKRDETIARIPRLEEIGINERPPKQPGLYVVRPLPTETPELDLYMMRSWEMTHHGTMFDESFMVPRMSPGFRALMTQGRSLRLPVIALTQRPSFLSPWFMSELTFIQVFFLTNPADKERMAEWMPGYDGSLQKNYHSLYYDQARHELDYLKPVPDEDEILNRFDLKMPRRIHLFKGITQNAIKKRRARL